MCLDNAGQYYAQNGHNDNEIVNLIINAAEFVANSLRIWVN